MPVLQCAGHSTSSAAAGRKMGRHVKSEHCPEGSSSLRRSTRQKPTCGICSREGFFGEGHVKTEMWMLCYQGNKQPPFMPTCPSRIPQHLVCFKCCPRNKEGTVEPGENIKHPNGERRPILTVEEFCKFTAMQPSNFKLYSYATGSDVDYMAKALNPGQVLHGKSEYGADIAEMTMIKSEL